MLELRFKVATTTLFQRCVFTSEIRGNGNGAGRLACEVCPRQPSNVCSLVKGISVY